MEPLSYTIDGYSRLTGIGRTMIYEKIKDGKLKTVKVGRRTLITGESGRALVEAA